MTIVASGQKVLALHFNNLLGRVTRIFNDSATSDPASLQVGYGQPMSVSQAAKGSVVKASQWTALRNDLNAVRLHQSGAAFDQASLPVVSGRNKITSAIANMYETALVAIEANPMSAHASRLVASNLGAPVTNTVAWGANDFDKLTTSSTFTFTSEANARYFFNAGGKLHVTLAHAVTDSANNLYWNELLGACGTINISASSTTATGSGTGGVGYYGMGTANQLLFTHTLQQNNSAHAGASPYTGGSNKVSVYGRKSADGSTITLTVDLLDVMVGQANDVSSGTTVQFGITKSVSFIIASPVLTTSAWVALDDPASAADTSQFTPTYSLYADRSTVDEGGTVTFILDTTNVAAGTSIPWSISGVTAADIVGGATSGNFVVDGAGRATQAIQLAADEVTEGTETLTMTSSGRTANVTVNDTSVTGSGSQTFLSSSTFTVPPGITSIRVSSVGGGGGGGGSIGNGDNHAGGAGGAGGEQYNVVYSVTPGSVYSVVVGTGGTPGSFIFNGTTMAPGGNGTRHGTNGTASYIQLGAGAQLALSTGGYGGNGAEGDNIAPSDANHLNGGSGNSGTPGNVPNPPGAATQRNNYPFTPGGRNSSQYGSGGNSNGNLNGTATAATAGGSGFVRISWGTSPSQFVFDESLQGDRIGYTLSSAAKAAGWDEVATLQANITVMSNARLYGTANRVGFNAGGSFPNGSSLYINNQGLIMGYGGTGGNPSEPGTSGSTALLVNLPTRINNANTIGGGGGGGGGGGSGGSVYGGIGGGGRVNGLSPHPDTYGSMTAPGAGGGSTIYGNGEGPQHHGGNGGSGGDLGQPGQPGGDAYEGYGYYDGEGTYVPPRTLGTGGAGGAPGAAVVGNGYVTWDAVGTRLGPLN